MRLPNNRRNRQRRPRFVRPPRPRRSRHFRWAIVLVPVGVFLAIWILSSIRVGFSWEDVMDALRVLNRPRYTQIAVLGLVCVGVVAIFRVLRGSAQKEKEE